MFYEIFRWFGLITGYLLQLAFFKTKVYYEDKKVQSRRIKGGALIVSNHYHVFDFGVAMFLLLPRKLYSVASELAYKNKMMYFGMRFFGGVQADRVSRSMNFIDEGAELLRAGKLLQIFPEGRNTPDGNMWPFKPSYIMLALRGNAPIIPLITNGEYGIFKRVRVIIGKPIYLSDYCTTAYPSREEIERLNAIVYEKAAELRQQLMELTENERKRK